MCHSLACLCCMASKCVALKGKNTLLAHLPMMCSVIQQLNLSLLRD